MDGSAWWMEIANMRDGVGSVVGTWFPDNVRLKVGNGADTLFWFDRWVGDIPFHVRFRRLFDLSDNKFLTVAQMFHLGWGEGGEAWKWRSRLWAWEEEQLVECRLLLLSVVLQVNKNDVWSWVPDLVACYKVKRAYHSLLAHSRVMPSTSIQDVPSI